MFESMRTMLSRRRRAAARLAATLAALAAIVATAGVSAPPAQADGEPGSIWHWGVIRSWAQGRCLDSNAKGDVYTIPCNGSQYQNWMVVIRHWDDNDWPTVQIRNVATGRLLGPICDTCGTWQPGVMTSDRPDANDWTWVLYPPYNGNWTAWRFAWDTGANQRCLDANTPTDTTNMLPYLGIGSSSDPQLPPNNCYSNFQDWKMGF